MNFSSSVYGIVQILSILLSGFPSDQCRVNPWGLSYSPKVLVSQLCLTLHYLMDCSPPSSYVHGILQARIVEWVAIPFSRGSSQPRDRTWVSLTAGRFFMVWATRIALYGANYFTVLYWFCHTSTWIHHGCTRVLHPEPPSHLPPCTIPLGHPSAPAPSILYHALNLDGDSFHIWYYTCFNAIFPNHPTLSLSHKVHKTVLYISVSFAVSYTGLLLLAF